MIVQYLYAMKFPFVRIVNIIILKEFYFIRNNLIRSITNIFENPI